MPVIASTEASRLGSKGLIQQSSVNTVTFSVKHWVPCAGCRLANIYSRPSIFQRPPISPQGPGGRAWPLPGAVRALSAPVLCQVQHTSMTSITASCVKVCFVLWPLCGFCCQDWTMPWQLYPPMVQGGVTKEAAMEKIGGCVRVHHIRGHPLKVDWMGRAVMRAAGKHRLSPISCPACSYEPLIRNCSLVKLICV